MIFVNAGFAGILSVTALFHGICAGVVESR
ncbi:hypothetical protein J2Z34_003062 [Youngiibacter multivorans]|uniref:Uncharacterized protein n=1 Tax=Youngiibacter multivorans TaxID=937251 RepID=A0ABS4G7P4_9CLOT|nr:hypothetical protein [Youngiibacter multivorans]